MKGRLVDLALSFDGKQRLTVELDGDFRQDFDDLKEYEVEITVKRYRKKRSLDSNAYAWVLIDKIAQKTRLPKSTVYRRAIRDLGGVSDTVCVVSQAAEKLCRSWRKQGLGWQAEIQPSKIKGCQNVILYYGSSSYDSSQMYALIESLKQECWNLGIETRTDEEIKSLMEGYDAE